MTDDPKPHRCRAGTEAQRCSFHGTRDELADHADEMGHSRCIVCAQALAWHEAQTCGPCVVRVRDDLRGIAIAYAHLERVISQAAYRGINWNALTLAADGSMESPQRPNQYTQPRDVKPTVHVEHRELIGDEVILAAYVEQRVPSDGREHVLDHWEKDPLSVLAFLERHERDWRHEFGADPAADIATVAGCLHYLRTRHELAARTHPGFDDYAAEVRELRVRLEHVVGLADDAVRAPAECFDCGGQLVRTFVAPTATTEVLEHDCQRCGQRHAGRHGDDGEGLTDDWTCRRCDRIYDQASYFLALRSRRDECQGWVPVRLAAEVSRRPEQTVWRWQQQGAVASVRDPETGQILVEWSEVSARSDAAKRQDRRSA